MAASLLWIVSLFYVWWMVDTYDIDGSLALAIGVYGALWYLIGRALD